METPKVTKIAGGLRYQYPSLTRKQFFSSLVSDSVFRKELIELFEECPLEAAHWACSVEDGPMLFTLLETEEVSADRKAFYEFFERITSAAIVITKNDDRLVIPTPLCWNKDYYAGLLQFMRVLSISEQQHAFLSLVGSEALTAKYHVFTGVVEKWLHVVIN